MAQRKVKRKQPKLIAPPQRFFERELAGEQAPSFQIMKTLFSRSAELLEREPWLVLLEHNLVMFDAPGSAEPCFCSVMGAAGRSFGLHVYIGLPSYFWFQEMQAGATITVGDFFARQYCVYVDFSDPADLEAPDRSLAKLMNHPLSKRSVAPVFRVIRPGYHPWYPTESEAGILAAGLDAFLVVCKALDDHRDADFWSIQNRYPHVTLVREHGTLNEFIMRLDDVPSQAPPMPKLPELDRARIQSILDRRLPSEGIIQVDHFYGAGMIGKRHERKACFRMALAIDARTAFAFPPEVSAPEAATGDLLNRTVLRAIEAQSKLPLEIHVCNREYKLLLAALAQALGIELKVKKSLPALEFAQGQLLAFMGDPGPLQ